MSQPIDRPVLGRRDVGQQHLNGAATDAADDEELAGHRHPAVGARVSGEAAELGDQLVEVVGEVVVERHGHGLAVLAVERDHQVDVVLGRVLEIVKIIVVVEIVALILEVERLSILVKHVHDFSLLRHAPPIFARKAF